MEGCDVQVWKRRQNAGGERVRERSFAPPDGRGRPYVRDFWWSSTLERSFAPPDGRGRPSLRDFWSCALRAPARWAENAICVLTLSWVGGCGARGRDRSSREAGGRNGHRGWRSHLLNA